MSSSAEQLTMPATASQPAGSAGATQDAAAAPAMTFFEQAEIAFSHSKTAAIVKVGAHVLMYGKPGPFLARVESIWQAADAPDPMLTVSWLYHLQDVPSAHLTPAISKWSKLVSVRAVHSAFARAAAAGRPF
jgi:hypothetical protein